MRSLILTLAVGVAGCSTTVTLTEVEKPLTELQKIADDVMPAGLLRTSSNGREFYSKLFVVNTHGDYEEAVGQKIAYQAHIEILGDRRPYTMKLLVRRLRRDGDGDYFDQGADEGFTRMISRKVKQTLHQRRGTRSVIDDFKPY
jgi:hypothetical protein